LLRATMAALFTRPSIRPKRRHRRRHDPPGAGRIDEIGDHAGWPGPAARTTASPSARSMPCTSDARALGDRTFRDGRPNAGRAAVTMITLSLSRMS
jgi:hypothetical protein